MACSKLNWEDKFRTRDGKTHPKLIGSIMPSIYETKLVWRARAADGGGLVRLRQGSVAKIVSKLR
jgi:hypothetical protein